MQKTIKMVALIGVLGISLIYAENEGVVQVPKTSKVPVTQDTRIINNFKKIDKLFLSINKKIGNIDKIKADIKVILANKNMEALCGTISSLNRDISRLDREITKIKDKSIQEKFQTKLEVHKSIRDEQKAILNQAHYECEKF